MLKAVKFIRSCIILPALLCMLAPAARAGVEIARVLPFATDREVRVQAFVTSTDQRPLELLGQIAPWHAGADAPPLWSGPLGTFNPSGGAGAPVEKTIDVSTLKPSLWTPATPALYELTVTARQGGRDVARQRVRFGFRSFTHENGRFLLNGKPVFLRGIAINPPERSIPDEVGYSKQFALDYVRFLRSRNVNIIRMTFQLSDDPRQQVWFDACDEVGMMVYQGSYGSPPAGAKGDADPEDDRDDSGKGRVPKDLDASVAAYRHVFERYVPHPSIVIYVLANELPGPVLSRPEWHDFLTAACAKLKAWDPTRQFLGNAGYGLGREGDILDVHRYWGWYYNSFLTYYNLRNTDAVYGKQGVTDDLPFTFSECVGSFTSAYGQFNHTFRKQLGAAQAWTGHSDDPAGDALAYQSFMVQRACESFRVMREVNPKLAGLMPFTILFYNWNGIERFEQMKPKPAMEQMGISYNPVLLSFECWTPNAYSGAKVKVLAHVVNDADDFSDLEGAALAYELTPADAKEAVASGQAPLPPVKYFAHFKTAITLDIPPDARSGEYVLRGRILREGKEIAHNSAKLFIAQASQWKQDPGRDEKPAVAVYDPSGKTLEALHRLGVETRLLRSLKNLSPRTPLIIGEGSADASIKPCETDLKRFLASGGRVLCLGQDHETFQQGWLPAEVTMYSTSINDPEYLHKKRPTFDHMNINPERPDHPVFKGLDRHRFHLWNDYTGWDQTKEGFPAVYPVRYGFGLKDPAGDAQRVAILANYDRGLEGVALCEMFAGGDDAGSVLLTGLDLVRRIGADPVADRVLLNLVDYLAEKEHPLYVTIDKPIVWGDYATERGVITSPANGLVENCRWLPPPTNRDAKPLADNTGAWNTLPGDQFVPIGRRPFGPWEYNQNTAPRDLEKDSKTGSGFFYATLASPRRTMVTTVENPSRQPAWLEAEVNGTKQRVTVEPGKTAVLRNAIRLKNGSRDVAVRYEGGKDLVIRQTAFE